MLILGIETSCDDTCAAVLCDGRDILSNVISSQDHLHQRFGGVVPEIACRRHLESVLPVIQEALDQADVSLGDIDAIAVTNRPGLVGALIVGVAAAKAMSLATGKPIVGVHHLEGHIWANRLSVPELEFPFVCLVVSGGHSEIYLANAPGDYISLARTVDDAAGECFDKAARAMGLGWPGGPAIDRLAEGGDASRVRFPRGRIAGSLDFSFSGLKTAVIRYLETRPEEITLADVASALQESIASVLVSHTIDAARRHGVEWVALGGGVAANSRLSALMQVETEKVGLRLAKPAMRLCTDNAAMIAAAAYWRVSNGIFDDLSLDVRATEPFAPALEISA